MIGRDFYNHRDYATVALRPVTFIFGVGDRRAANVLQDICDMPSNDERITETLDRINENCARCNSHRHALTCLVTTPCNLNFGKLVYQVRALVTHK